MLNQFLMVVLLFFIIPPFKVQKIWALGLDLWTFETNFRNLRKNCVIIEKFITQSNKIIELWFFEIMILQLKIVLLAKICKSIFEKSISTFLTKIIIIIK